MMGKYLYSIDWYGMPLSFIGETEDNVKFFANILETFETSSNEYSFIVTKISDNELYEFLNNEKTYCELFKNSSYDEYFILHISDYIYYNTMAYFKLNPIDWNEIKENRWMPLPLYKNFSVKHIYGYTHNKVSLIYYDYDIVFTLHFNDGFKGIAHYIPEIAISINGYSYFPFPYVVKKITDDEYIKILNNELNINSVFFNSTLNRYYLMQNNKKRKENHIYDVLETSKSFVNELSDWIVKL